MAYEVTATRRRPQRFEDMIGQDFVVATLQKSITAGKIAHAYLFSGPRGCGKTSSARILAKALNCEKGPSATPCGVCSACTEITRGSSLDVIEIDGASNTSVNDVRQIKDEVQFPPNSCRYKVYIIDEVHMLSTSAFNALLKTIEEPPPYVIFIFATTELHKVPATIKSRCQQFNFRLVPVEMLKDSLSLAASESGIAADDEALFWVAREATGSVRDAYTLFDQVAAFSDGHITFEKIRDKLGLVGVDRINPVIEACVDKSAQAALTLLDDIIQNGVSVEQFTVDTADYFRNLLLIRNGITRESLLGQNPERFSSKVLSGWTAIQIERALGLMLQLYRDLRYSLDPRYELELAISRLSWISEYVSAAEMKAAIVQARTLLQNGTTPAASAAAHRPPPVARDSGPFSEADCFVETETETVRESAEEKPEAAAPDDRIQNPFAALKEKIGIGVVAVSPEALPVGVPAEAQSDGREELPSVLRESIPFDQLQDRLVALFQDSKNMVATSLSQAFDWKDNGSSFSFTVNKPFVHNFLEQDHKLIAEEASTLLGRPVGLEIHLDSAKDPDVKLAEMKPEIPAPVEMLRRMVYGTIVKEG